jgi:hypothetical protein
VLLLCSAIKDGTVFMEMFEIFRVEDFYSCNPSQKTNTMFKSLFLLGIMVVVAIGNGSSKNIVKYNALQNQIMVGDSHPCDSLEIAVRKAFAHNDSILQIMQVYVDSVISLKRMLASGNRLTTTLLGRIDTLSVSLNHWKYVADTLLENYNKLIPVNRELNAQISNMQKQISEQKDFLDKQAALIVQKERILKEKDDIYKDAIMGSKIDLVKLEGKLNSKDQEIFGKSREIDLLSQSIQEKQRDIERKNEEITKIATRREMSDKIIDSLRDSLSRALQIYVKLDQEQKYARLEIADLKAKLAARDKRDKQVAVVQGVAMRSYRTPLYILAPKDVNNLNSYEIANENAGNFEFDLVTGAAVRLFKISQETARYNSDIGWFVGFGGKNLFKNFYFGPNLKLFDYIHINAGLNVAEFRVLKSGFNEGDILPLGVPIPTVNQWQFNAYFTLSFDFELITQVAGKLK